MGRSGGVGGSGGAALKARRHPVIDETRCKQCGLCAAACTREALTWRAHEFPVLNADLCNSCRNCELICPDFAIVLGEETETGLADATCDKPRFRGD